jgi:hypothetical protein
MQGGQPLRDSAAFWLALGGGVTVIGGIFVGVGVAVVTKVPSGELWLNAWFDGGIAAVVVGGLGMLWALVLHIAHGHILAHERHPPRQAADSIRRQLTTLASAASTLPATQPHTTPDRQNQVDTDVTSEQLTAMFQNVTEVQGRRLVAPYLGKWLTVSGLVRDVDSAGGQRVRILFEDHPAYAYFDANQADRVSLFVRGQRMTVRGVIENIGSYGVALHHCEIVASDQAEPSQPAQERPRPSIG